MKMIKNKGKLKCDKQRLIYINNDLLKQNGKFRIRANRDKKK